MSPCRLGFSSLPTHCFKTRCFSRCRVWNDNFFLSSLQFQQFSEGYSIWQLPCPSHLSSFRNGCSVFLFGPCRVRVLYMVLSSRRSWLYYTENDWCEGVRDVLCLVCSCLQGLPAATFASTVHKVFTSVFSSCLLSLHTVNYYFNWMEFKNSQTLSMRSQTLHTWKSAPRSRLRTDRLILITNFYTTPFKTGPSHFPWCLVHCCHDNKVSLKNTAPNAEENVFIEQILYKSNSMCFTEVTQRKEKKIK